MHTADRSTDVEEVNEVVAAAAGAAGAPRADLRRILHPVGPVLVFAARIVGAAREAQGGSSPLREAMCARRG